MFALNGLGILTARIFTSRNHVALDVFRVTVPKDTFFFTIVEIHTHDVPGLLYQITSTLLACKLDTWVAKIGTKADQVVDVFYVRDFDGQKIVNPDQVASIRDAIEQTLASIGVDQRVREAG